MRFCLSILIWMAASFGPVVAAEAQAHSFPPPLESYGDTGFGLWKKLLHRAQAEPLNLVATVIFALAILHTFAAPKLMQLAHRWRDEHREQIEQAKGTSDSEVHPDAVEEVSFKAEIAHFFGEVEAIFGIWIIPLLIAFLIWKDWSAAENYINHGVHFTEPLFVVVVMTIAATRPILLATEGVMKLLANLAGGTSAAYWLTILTVGPLLGSLITEPAAMTIAALLLARRFYEAQPGKVFGYATLGLLFVNVSIGGTLTHFAAPPVLMVAGKWGWGAGYMLGHFGWKAVLAICASNAAYYFWFRREFINLNGRRGGGPSAATWEERTDAIPSWITIIHLIFLAWTVFTAHSPAFFIGGFLFFLAFAAATEHHQNPVVLRPALLVGFFLAGLVVHGGLQSWWIAPVLESMNEVGLFFGAVILTAFNDNAAITYLASLVPLLSEPMKYAVVAGAVAGGGLTVIANAPNPAGQAILGKYFPDGVSPLGLLFGAIPATVISILFFLMMS